MITLIQRCNINRMKKIFIVGLIFLSLLGCSKHSAPSTNTTISSQQIEQVMMDINVGSMNYEVSDGVYSLPDRNFIGTDFSVALKSFFSQMGDSDYTSGENNCNVFSLGSSYFMKHLHHNTKTNKLDNTGIAFGEFYYIKEGADGGGHAINVSIVNDKNITNKFIVLFYEPQTCSIVQLTQTEIESCVFYRF